MVDVKIKHERNSSIELLKIFAIILIVFSHSVPSNFTEGKYYICVGLTTSDIQRLIVSFYKYFGQIGNAIFIVCSSYFLIDDNRVSGKKMFHLASDTWVIFVLSLIVCLCLGVEMSSREILKIFFPVTFNLNWFVCCYIVFYMIHGALNTIINSLSQEKLLMVSGIMLFIYGGLSEILYGSAFYYTRLVGFIMIYFIVAYVKRYMKEFAENSAVNFKLLIGSTAALLLLFLITNYLGLKISVLSAQLDRWNTIQNPFIIMMAISAFSLANNKYFTNKYINYISSVSLLTYVIHNNYSIKKLREVYIWESIYSKLSTNYELLWISLMALCLLVFGVGGGILYKLTLQKYIYMVADKFYGALLKVYKSWAKAFMRIH